MKHRIISVTLAAALGASLLATPVFAEGETGEPGDSISTEFIADGEDTQETDGAAAETGETPEPEDSTSSDASDAAGNNIEEPGETAEEAPDAEMQSAGESETGAEESVSGEPAPEETVSGEPAPEETVPEEETVIEEEDVGELAETVDLSGLQIGTALTEDDLACQISTYSVSNCDTVKVTGTCNYTYAYQILDMVNEERAAYGLSALKMDTDLMDAAMQRAAETSIYWSHTRPSGKSCTTVSSKVSGENIAAGSSYLGPYFIMYGWMNSSGHRANILSSSYQSIGIGVFEMNGYIYWVQDFGRSSASTVTKSGTASKTFSVDIDPSTIQSSLTLSASSTSLSVGGTTTLSAKIKNTEMSDLGSVYATIDNSSLKWSSGSTSVATVSSSGIVTAVGNGSAKITAKTSNGGLSSSVTITCSEGELKKVNGSWGYYINGKLQTSYTGFAANSNGKWYVEKGKVTKKTNGVFKDTTGAIGSKNNWYYVVGSKVQTGFTGLANYKNSSGWWYITKGVVDRSYQGLAKNNNGWFYLTNGKVDRSYTGFSSNSNGKWYVEKGKVTKKTNGVFKDTKGAIGSKNNWYYVVGSKVQTGFTGLANYKNSSGWWYITKGVVDRSYNGLAKNNNGWWYLKNGKVDRSYTGLATNSNGTWYVKDGKVQKSYTGTVTVNGKKYSVTKGKVKT